MAAAPTSPDAGPKSFGAGLALALVGVWIVLLAAVGITLGRYVHLFPTRAYILHYHANIQAPPAPLKPLPDVDAMAARMTFFQDVYRRERDDALAAYTQEHPKAAPCDDDAHAELKLLAYLQVWDDFYDEGLWQQYETHADDLGDLNFRNAVFNWTGKLMHQSPTEHSTSEADAMATVTAALDFDASPYPADLKYTCEVAELNNLIRARNARAIQPGPGTAYDHVPQLVDLALANFGVMLREKRPNEYLYYEGWHLLFVAERDEPTLDAVSDGLERTFLANDKDDPLAAVLKANYWLRDADAASGEGFAFALPTSRMKSYLERLNIAQGILHKTYLAHPEQTGIPSLMMIVATSLHKPRAEMELWFQRGLKLTADPYPYYVGKARYLDPKWNGTADGQWAFAEECADQGDWAQKIPLVVLTFVNDRFVTDRLFYTRPEKWQLIDSVCRQFLEHYPDASTLRTTYLKMAVEGGHWRVAREQFARLGSDWDRSVLPSDEYRQAGLLIAAHSWSQ